MAANFYATLPQVTINFQGIGLGSINPKLLLAPFNKRLGPKGL